MKEDAQTFADWEVDYVKLDGCNSDPFTMDVGYPEFGRYLNKTGRPIVYSCSWPVYQEEIGKSVNILFKINMLIFNNIITITISVEDRIGSIIYFLGRHSYGVS